MKTGFATTALLFAALTVTAPASAYQAEGAKPVKEKKVCRRDNSVGTRLSKMVCLTRDQWKKREEASAASRDRILDSAEREGRDAWTPYVEPAG